MLNWARIHTSLTHLPCITTGVFRWLCMENCDIDSAEDYKECSSGTDVCLDGLCRDTCVPGKFNMCLLIKNVL